MYAVQAAILVMQHLFFCLLEMHILTVAWIGTQMYINVIIKNSNIWNFFYNFILILWNLIILTVWVLLILTIGLP